MTTAIGSAAYHHMATTTDLAQLTAARRNRLEGVCETAMCIDASSLDYFGRSSGPIAVYCAVTLTVLGRTEGAVQRNRAGQIAGRFQGCAFVASKHPTSGWFTLAIIVV